LEMMRYADEIVAADEIDVPPADHHKVADRELKAAIQLINSMSTKFDPARYVDEYRDCIMSLVERKSRGEEIHVKPAEKQHAARAGDLISALEATLGAAGKRACVH